MGIWSYWNARENMGIQIKKGFEQLQSSKYKFTSQSSLNRNYLALHTFSILL